MPSFHQLADKVIKNADVLLMVLDARMPEVTSNDLLRSLVGDKPLLYVINKIDLVPEVEWQAIKKRFKPSIAISSTKHLGTMMLLRKINAIARGKEVVVGVIGYPNTGKSSLINALRSRQSASVSSVAGHTKAIQKIRVSENVLLLDTPGVLPRDDKKDEELMHSHEILGTVDAHRIKEPDLAVAKLLIAYPGRVQAHYGVDGEDPDEVIEAIALKKNFLLGGAKPDSKRMARQILIDFQKGKLKF